jgi:hypothetical protein
VKGSGPPSEIKQAASHSCRAIENVCRSGRTESRIQTVETLILLEFSSGHWLQCATDAKLTFCSVATGTPTSTAPITGEEEGLRASSLFGVCTPSAFSRLETSFMGGCWSWPGGNIVRTVAGHDHEQRNCAERFLRLDHGDLSPRFMQMNLARAHWP